MATPLKQQSQQAGCVYIGVGRTRLCSYQWQAARNAGAEMRYLEACAQIADLKDRNQELLADLARLRRLLGVERPALGIVAEQEEEQEA